MVTILLGLILALVLIQTSQFFGRFQLTVDALGGLLLATAVIGLINNSYWFLLVALPAIGLIVSTLNSHFGIVSRSKVKFKSERSWLALGLALTVVCAWLLYRFNVEADLAAAVVVAALLVVSFGCHLLLLVHLQRYRLGPKKKLELSELKSLPTVSVLIPARNESHALNDTITKLLQSTYPKLEVLILDDCSHDKTPEIIRSFAHDGARFLEGTPPPEDWLGRNWALQQLTDAANGELLIFADTDVKFSADSVADIVGVMQRDDLDMASFVPAQTPSGFLGWLLPSLTNFWLSLMPFQLLHGRAAIGRCFAITSTAMPTSSLEQFKSSIYPVYKLSKQLLSQNLRYKFFFGKKIDLTIQQHYHSMSKALRRSLSPALRNRIDLATLLVAVALIVLIVPFVALANGNVLLSVVVLASITLLFVQVAITAGGPLSAFVSLLWPLHVAHELVQLVWSVVRYRFTDLNWKQRQVCMPLLQTHEKLPEI